MNKFKGILFTLKKRIENISENDNDYYKYLVMGYYDGLEINTVDQWYKMRPRGLRELNLQVDISSPFVDQYTMRAFFPENNHFISAPILPFPIASFDGRKPQTHGFRGIVCPVCPQSAHIVFPRIGFA